MMNFIEKVGDIKVYTEKNFDRDITVTFINGTEVVKRDIYITDNESDAIADLFKKLDIYTEEFLYLYVNGLEKMSNNTYRSGEKDYFCRIDDTRYFKHFYKSADEFIRDKNGLRIIDK